MVVGGKQMLIFGLGKFGGGVGVTKYLISRGAKIRVVDEATQENLQTSIEKLKDFDIDYRFGPLTSNCLKDIDLVVVNSAVPPVPLLIDCDCVIIIQASLIA